MAKDTEEIIEPIEDGDADTEAAAKALEAGGDELGAMRLKLERAQNKLKRERDARKQGELVAVRTALASEFEYADPELIVGRSESEMRASAERAHNAVLKVIASKGLVKSNLTPEQIAAAEAVKLKTDWGAPPAVATEAVTGEAPMEFAELSEKARTGAMSRKDVLADIANNGPRRIVRPTIASSAIRGRGEQQRPA